RCGTCAGRKTWPGCGARRWRSCSRRRIGPMAGLHDLKPSPGSRRRPRRVGRGIGSGHGKTAGRGHKGQKARSGGTVRPGFEGGQTPLQRRLPKRGFTNAPFKRVLAEVNVEALNRFDDDTEVTPDLLREHGLVKGRWD